MSKRVVELEIDELLGMVVEGVARREGLPNGTKIHVSLTMPAGAVKCTASWRLPNQSHELEKET